MRRLAWILALLAALMAAPLVAQETDEMPPEVQEMLDSFTPQTGEIKIPEAKATLNLGEDYLFYGPEDAKAILTMLWGNPPETAEGTLGLVMPAGTTALSDTWGAVITYEDTGYVSDEDAQDTDYDELLESLQEGATENNEARRAAGYQGVEIIGWAEAPKYDASNHSVIWAQDLKFDGEEVNTLNYDLRTLGRSGVLSMNLISVMPEIEVVRKAAAAFATHAQFDEGARYADFDPATDRVAEYGIGGLVAAGVGVAAAKKLGIFALLLKFIKPILIGLFIFFAAFGRKILGMFGRKEEYDEEVYYEDETESDDDAAPVATLDGEPIEQDQPKD